MKKGFENLLLLLFPLALICGRSLLAEPRYNVEASVDRSFKTVKGKARIEMEGRYTASGSVLLWLYPNRLSAPPENLNAMNRHWIYPYDFNPGWMKIMKVTSGGKDLTGTVEEVRLPRGHPLSKTKRAAVSVKVEPGAADIEIQFIVGVPKRYGLFGRTSGGLFLATGWHPLLVHIGDDGKPDFYSPPERARYEVEVEAEKEFHVLIEDRHFPPEELRDGGRVKAVFDGAAHVSLSVLKNLHIKSAECGGLRLRVMTLDPYETPPDYRPGGEEVAGVPLGIQDVSRPDRIGHAMNIICRGAAMVGGLEGQAPAGGVLTIVEAPLGMEIAAATEKVIFVSDRAYTLFPFARFWKFHDLGVLRALWSRLFLEVFKARGHPYNLAAMEADFIATELVERWMREVLAREEYAEDLLKWGSFLSSIDYLLYSPMVQFREAYFHTIAEKDWLRDEPWAFMNLEPRGKLIFEKLKDIVGEEKISGIVRDLAAGVGDIHELAGRAAGMDMGWFFDQWSVCYPSLNYRMGKVQSTRLPGGDKRHRAQIFREGDEWVKEPVAVKFVFEGGEEMEAVWFEQGGEGSVEVISSRKLLNVIVDPEGRLFEDPELADNHPRFDNALHQPFRPPVFAGLSIWSSLYEMSGALVAFLSARHKYDLKRDVRFLVEASSFGYGITTWFLGGFGPKRDLNYSSFYAGPLVSIFYHSPDFGFEEEGKKMGATALSAGLFLRYDDTFFVFDPDRGTSVSGYAVWHLNVADDREVRYALSVDLRALYLHPFSGAHSLAVYGAVGGTFFEMTEGQLQSLSGRLALRAFEQHETLGRMRALMAIEYRHLFVHGLKLRLLDIVTLEGINGVLFAGGGTVSEEDGYGGMFTTGRIFSEAGYGLVFLVTYLGAYPGVIELDVAVPVYPSPWERIEEEDRRPVGIYLSFYQTY